MPGTCHAPWADHFTMYRMSDYALWYQAITSGTETSQVVRIHRIHELWLVRNLKGVTEALCRKLRMAEMTAHSRPTNTIQSMLVNPKDKEPTENRCRVVYQQACEQCDYIHLRNWVDTKKNTKWTQERVITCRSTSWTRTADGLKEVCEKPFKSGLGPHPLIGTRADTCYPQSTTPCCHVT